MNALERIFAPVDFECRGMAWATPQSSKRKVDAAGQVLIEEWHDEDDQWPYRYMDALDVLNNWRSSHSFPLNTFQVTLRKKAFGVDPNAIVAQRIKRLSSIEAKLHRFPGLRLSQMQDIGGCRAVVDNVFHVKELAGKYRTSELRHTLVRCDDYLEMPQSTGYRGVHLIYRYVSDRGGRVYNGLLIEMQLRSQLQHAWATAVETVGAFTRQALKSSQGESDYLRFFELMGTVLAREEGTAPVPNTPANDWELIDELSQFATKLDIVNRLNAFGTALDVFETFEKEKETSPSHYFLIDLNIANKEVTIAGYDRRQLSDAQDAYLKAEQANADDPGRDAVLVSVDTIASLRRAYPNYFLDTQVFRGVVSDALAGRPVRVRAEPITIVERPIGG